MATPLSAAGLHIAHKLSVESEELEEKRIAARRARAEQRRGRLLDPRAYNAAVDLNTVQAQIEEKRIRKEAEREAERKWAEEQRRVLEFLSTRQAEEHAAKQRDKRALLESWKEQAGKRGHERKGAAEPESEGPPSPAAMRHFGGEDALAAERKRMQQLQAKQWIAQQVAEREAAQRREREEDQKYAHYLREADECRRQLEEEQVRRRKEEQRRVQELNLRLAQEKRGVMRRTRGVGEEEAVTLDLPGASDTPVSPRTASGRIRRDHYTGMTPEELARIHEEQRRQMEQRRDSFLQEKQREKEWGDAVQRNVRYAQSLAAEQEEARLREQRRLREALQQQRTEQARQAKRERALHTNEVTEDFFGAFGRSDR